MDLSRCLSHFPSFAWSFLCLEKVCRCHIASFFIIPVADSIFFILKCPYGPLLSFWIWKLVCMYHQALVQEKMVISLDVLPWNDCSMTPISNDFAISLSVSFHKFPSIVFFGFVRNLGNFSYGLSAPCTIVKTTWSNVNSFHCER